MRNAAKPAAQAAPTHTHTRPPTYIWHAHCWRLSPTLPPHPSPAAWVHQSSGKSIDMCRCAAFGRLQIANQSINNWNENHFAGFNLSSPSPSRSHAQARSPRSQRLCCCCCCCVTLRFGCVCKWAKLCTSITGIGSESASKAAVEPTHTLAHTRTLPDSWGVVKGLGQRCCSPGCAVSAFPGVRD